jgi:multicomponent K+:H+ antiporter subunit A
MGALSKSAQVPFPLLVAARDGGAHTGFCLPALGHHGQGRGVSVRTPVAGLSGSEEWFWIVSGAWACTLLIGAYAAMFQNDLKGLLAYSTISHLGLITLLLGLNSPLAAVAAVFHILNHATFKASLFMAAGIIDHESGTRDIRRLSGLIKLMPFTATLAMVASAAMAGRATAQRLPVEGNVLRRDRVHQRHRAGSKPRCRLSPRGRHLQRRVLAALHRAMCSSARTSHRPAAHPARTTALDARAGGVAGAHLPLGRNFPGTPGRPVYWPRALPVVGGELPEYSLAIWHG